jgi:hypothetical protein
MRRALWLAGVLSASWVSAEPVNRVVAEVETGPLHVFRNDGRYGEGGTWFQKDDVGQGRNLYPSWRASVELGLGERHALVFLYAPVELTTVATLEDPLVFRGVTFDAGTVISHRYLFDGYRGSYLFRALERGPLRLEVGGSFQVRNAAVQFTALHPERFASETDIGLVFALKGRLRYTLASGLYGALEADGLSTFGLVSGADGGILDAALSLGAPLSQEAELFFRLRVVGGGARVPRRDLENWAWLGTANIGLRADLMGLLRR